MYMRSIILPLGILLTLTSAAQACVSAVDRGGLQTFANGCPSPVIVKYSTNSGLQGVVGPIAPNAELPVANLPAQPLYFWYCDYDQWASGTCGLP
jgi:hypothetical protein